MSDAPQLEARLTAQLEDVPQEAQYADIVAPFENKRSYARAGKAAVAVLAIVTLLVCWSFAFSWHRAYANPADAVPATEDGTAIVGSYSAAKDREPDDNTLGLEDDSQLRDEQGRVSQLSTDTHNPYNGQIRLDIDIGSEFAEFEGSDITEGIRIKVSPGGVVKLPALHARDGYYFVGWGQGGVPYEPTWSPFVTEVEMDTDTSNGKNTSIFALYADDEGNGYCTCGAYEQGVYAGKMDEIKQVNAEYNETLGYDGISASTSDWSKTVMVLVIIAFCVAALGFAAWKDRQDEKNGDTEFL